MKWRIKRKKIKKHHICNIWLKCEDDWYKAITNIRNKYGHDDANKYNHIDFCQIVIGCNMLRYDWNQYLNEGKKIGFGFRVMNKYANEKLNI